MKTKTFIAHSLALFALLSPIIALSQESKPDAQGYIRDWLMLAPIPLGVENEGATKINEEQIKGEGALKPKSGDKVMVGGKEMTWKTVHASTNFFDFNEILKSQNENAAGYMVAYVVCEKDLADVTLLMGSNDQGKVYLNGKQVVKFAETRTFELDSDKAANLTLTKGVNTIVFKVINENNNWQGSIRFQGKDGKPVTDFKVKLMP